MKRRFTLSVSALISLAVAGCGSGSTPPAAPPTTNTAPTITSVTPTSASAGGASLTIDVKGSGFVAASTLQWNGAALSTIYISATELSANLPASDLANGTTAELTVVNTGEGGGTSAAAPFVVNNPDPSLASINPLSAPAGAGALSLDITGSGFVPSSVVTWNNAPLATTFVSGTEVKAALPAANDSIGVIAAVAVSNPTPAGGNSGAIPL
jgi:trimeric autotransporter adhesin